jgi:hypothetical protein
VSRARKYKCLRHASHHLSYRFYYQGKMHLGVVAGRRSAGRLALPVRLLPMHLSGRLFLCSLQVGIRDCSNMIHHKIFCTSYSSPHTYSLTRRLVYLGDSAPPNRIDKKWYDPLSWFIAEEIVVDIIGGWLVDCK